MKTQIHCKSCQSRFPLLQYKAFGKVELSLHYLLKKKHKKETRRVSEFGFRNPRNFCLWNLESLTLESRIKFKESGIHSTLTKNLESGFTAWNPESKTVLDSITCMGRGARILTTSLQNKTVKREAPFLRVFLFSEPQA